MGLTHRKWLRRPGRSCRAGTGVVFVGNQKNWGRVGQPFGYGRQGAAGGIGEWHRLVVNQTPKRPDNLNVGGFNDAVFRGVAGFLVDAKAGSWPRSRRWSCRVGCCQACCE